MYSNRQELEKFRKFKGPLIDVRSPEEYYKGNLPNSINIPLFDNEERSIVGTVYKNYGRPNEIKRTSVIDLSRINNKKTLDILEYQN